MSTLKNAMDEYLTLRRALGYKLYEDGLLLQQFVQFAESEKVDFITTRLALHWATQPVNVQPAHHAKRLRIVRSFAKYRSASDPRTEVPPANLLPSRVYRPAPYIYTDNDVRRLIKAALQLPSVIGLRRHTYATLFGLIAVSGMRIGELLHLDREDVDLKQAILTVRNGKFGKMRWIPLHSSTQQALQQYGIKRDHLCPNPQAPSFFVSERGVRLTGDIVRHTFVKLSRQIGLRGPTDTHGPRLHDFRHRFAVNTLLEWYRSDTDVDRHLLELSTYLGHVHVTDTYWYLSATPELLQLAVRRLECE